MTHPDFPRAAAYVTDDDVRSLLMDLVDISSPTGKEIGVAQYLVARMRKSGMDTELQFVDADRPNAVGHRRGRGDGDRKSTRLNSSHIPLSRMPSSA